MAGLVALGLTRLLHGVLVSRATDHETYGLVGSLIAVTTIASLLLPAGLASAAAKFIPYQHGRGDDSAARGVYRLVLRVGWVGAIGLGVAAGWGAREAFDLRMLDTIQVTALCTAFSMYSVLKSVLYGFDLVSGYTKLELACSVLSLSATALVVALGWSVYLLPLAAGYALFTFGAWWRLRPMMHGAMSAPGRAQRREIAAFIALACVGTLCSQGFLQGTQLLANRFAAPRDVAYFAAAVTLIAPVYFVPRALGIVLFPAMARAHGAGDVSGVRRQADLSTRALLAVLAPLLAAALPLAPEVLTVFGGSGYAGGAPVLRLMLAATYLAVVSVPAVNALSSGAHVRVPVASAVLGTLTGFAVVALLGGATGVGLGYLCGTAVTAGGPFVIAWRHHGMSWSGPVLRGVGVVGGALLASWWLPREPAFGAALAGVVLAASVLVLRGDLVTLRRGRGERPDDSATGQRAVAGSSPTGRAGGV